MLHKINKSIFIDIIGVVILTTGAYGLLMYTDWNFGAIFFTLFAFAMVYWRVDSRVPIAMALGGLILIMLLLAVSGQNQFISDIEVFLSKYIANGHTLTEELAVWVYFSLVIGVVMQIFEHYFSKKMLKEDDHNSAGKHSQENNSFIEGVQQFSPAHAGAFVPSGAQSDTKQQHYTHHQPLAFSGVSEIEDIMPKITDDFQDKMEEPISVPVQSEKVFDNKGINEDMNKDEYPVIRRDSVPTEDNPHLTLDALQYKTGTVMTPDTLPIWNNSGVEGQDENQDSVKVQVKSMTHDNDKIDEHIEHAISKVDEVVDTFKRNTYTLPQVDPTEVVSVSVESDDGRDYEETQDNTTAIEGFNNKDTKSTPDVSVHNILKEQIYKTADDEPLEKPSDDPDTEKTFAIFSNPFGLAKKSTKPKQSKEKGTTRKPLASVLTNPFSHNPQNDDVDTNTLTVDGVADSKIVSDESSPTISAQNPFRDTRTTAFDNTRKEDRADKDIVSDDSVILDNPFASIDNQDSTTIKTHKNTKGKRKVDEKKFKKQENIRKTLANIMSVKHTEDKAVSKKKISISKRQKPLTTAQLRKAEQLRKKKEQLKELRKKKKILKRSSL
jgi:hypothetical protein